ncbi:MAG: amidohydrolase [Acidobacteria bacterium]|nr:amidohydrolase [Acidobacteriota bacterium]
MKRITLLVAGLLVTLGPIAGARQDGLVPAPDRRPGEGLGPFPTLTIRNVMVIDGTGAPPFGPANVIVENNRIARIVNAGTPGVPSKEPVPPAAPNMIDGTGMYVMPGFVNLHTHLGDARKAPQNEYVYKLYMAHGVTTMRGVELAAQPMAAREKERSAANAIVAPRIYNYQRPGAGWASGLVDSPEKAREWVRWCAANGVDGMKLVAYPPAIMAALLDEAKKHGLGSTAHLEQRGVAQMDALTAAKLGLGTVTHFYGHFEPLLRDNRVQPWPDQMNYNDEQYRFGQVGRLWNLIHPPGSDEWKAYLQAHLKLNTIFDPTMTAYAATRDVMRMRNADWHEPYTLPSLMDFFTPNRENHGSYYFDWSAQDEVAWRNFYQVWFRLVNDYKNMGGRVTVSDDAAYTYNTWGFGYIHEMELLHEAGFHPLEVIRAATMHGAEALHEPKNQPLQFGIVRAGMLADMVLVDQNPIRNLKILYGTGHLRLNDSTGRTERVGGVRYTIKDGIVYDARKLLADVGAMVAAQKKQRKGQP